LPHATSGVRRAGPARRARARRLPGGDHQGRVPGGHELGCDEAKWDGFREAFADFDPETVAGFGPDEVERLAADARIVRNRRKIEATVDNAQALIALHEDTPGGFGAWIESQGGFEERLDALRKHFKFLGDFGSYYLMYVVKQPVPPYEEARAIIESRGR
jgi:hypothetical protein